MAEPFEDELSRTAHAWDAAMTGNDADAIGRYMADDWTIVGSDGAVSGKAGFLALVRSGALTHNEMSSADITIRIYGDTAVLICRGVSGGKYHGLAFREVERSSNVFVRRGGEWQCVHTHLSRLAPAEPQ